MTGACQIPGCFITKQEIETELQSYLNGYCQTCQKQREGRLCGCAFPCCNTFKGPMLSMIYSLLEIGVPSGVKQINVCYKHASLLRQAREKCYSSRSNSSDRTKVQLPSQSGEKKGYGQSKQGELRFAVDSSVTGNVLGGLETSTEGVTNFVITDSSDQSNIIIQEMQDSDKMVKLNFSDMEGYMAQIQHKQSEEDMEQSLELEIEGREARLEEELEYQVTADNNKPTKTIQEQVVDTYETSVADIPVVVSDNMRAPIPYHEPSSKPVVYSAAGIKPKLSQLQPPTDNAQVFKIQYPDFITSMLTHELGQLLTSADLGDTVLVCGDGKVVTSSLLLNTAIPWLSATLDTIIRIDQYKTVIMPEEVSVISMSLLLNIICAQTIPILNSVELQILKSLCTILHCQNIFNMVNSSQTQGFSIPVKRKMSSSPRKVTMAKQARLEDHCTMEQTNSKQESNVKLEKSDLNADYLDSTGLVRLSSVDEMALHYCIMCDKKFKKYNQAITHYDAEHNLPAALACDMCEETFKEIYNCVKHKHEVHGQFDENFQCYICKDVLYSRFRLNSHIKEMHRAHHEEVLCKACGMKFPAQHYFINHEKEKHSANANTCNICGKTFSGKRYLTMHIKASHESSPARKDKLQCVKCDLKFTSPKERSLHMNRQHKQS